MSSKLAGTCYIVFVLSKRNNGMEGSKVFIVIHFLKGYMNILCLFGENIVSM